MKAKLDNELFKNLFGSFPPPSYLDFLNEDQADNYLSKAYFVKTETDGYYNGFDFFTGIDQENEYENIKYYSSEEYGLPSNHIVIAVDGYGNFITLDLSASRFGQIYFIDYFIHDVKYQGHDAGVILIAKSFESFLNELIDGDKIDT